ncbi:hypothetical protein HK099_002422 [Clydaea vesicula]|uniref:Uncharacterized protein n=1 Tax=Clydaea vesicula TaxID=447962 RepID=A0AAD5XZ78_9FUNG|nr:hypothetical protein HK099_002422 [Clydaea vesicula]
MNPFKQNTVYKFRRSYHAVGFAFDIDGVLIKGKRLLNQTKPALKLLSERKIPFIFLTNGGGVKEQMKADQLAQLFDLPKSLVKKYRNDLVVVIGGAKNECKKVAKNYGFEKVLTTNDVLRTNHSIWPFSNAFDSEEDDSFDLSKEPFKAIMMFHDSRDWGRDLQICTDILRSKNGILGTVKDNGTPQA